jgi:methionyl-tRNA synthetase
MAMEFVKAAPARRLLRWQSALTRPRGWVCHSCRGNFAVASRRFSSQAPSTSDKPYYVTTPIFYVNAGMCWMHLLSCLAFGLPCVLVC